MRLVPLPLSSFRKYVVPRFYRILLPRNVSLKNPDVTSRKLETVFILLWGDHAETRSHAYLLGSQFSIDMGNVIPFKAATLSGTRTKDILPVQTWPVRTGIAIFINRSWQTRTSITWREHVTIRVAIFINRSWHKSRGNLILELLLFFF